ncbi:beta-galactosidase [Paenibacillus chungangensis]|uniref:Beta-galactosidase n=1 Tax=Paenibacillus chungangensis TaxID=696535 RepID=A0ABW3HQW4_9BACL
MMIDKAQCIPATLFTCKDNTCIESISSSDIVVRTEDSGGEAWLDAAACTSLEWQANDYLYMDVTHRSHDVLVVVLRFVDLNQQSITVHFGVLPGVETRICLPLKALAGDELFLSRFPGVLQTVLRGDPSVDRSGIIGFGIGTIASTASRCFTIGSIYLSKELPDFNYAVQPLIDELGQLTDRRWKGKTGSEQEMRVRMEAELSCGDPEISSSPELSVYGGWKELCFESSGYFRTEFDGDRWWFVDPEGYALFSAGMDCVQPSDSMRVNGMEHLLPDLPGKHGAFRDAWSSESEYSFMIANWIRICGTSWRKAWMEVTEQRLKQWGINTIGNWSDGDFIAKSTLPYVYPMHSFPGTSEFIYRDFPDVFSEEYERNAETFASQLMELQNDRRMIGYFMRNEPHWAFVDSLNLTERLLMCDRSLKSKTYLAHWLQAKYGEVSKLNEAWDMTFGSFEELESKLNGLPTTVAAREDCERFHRIMIRRYVEIPAASCRKASPHHLNLGMRYAWVANDDILEGCEAFDVFSINCYQMKPDKEMIKQIADKLNRPLMIGEFHFGAADAGLPAYGIRAVASQRERADAYRHFVEQSAAIPELIGVHYFQLNDQPALGRFDGENYQIGVIDVCLRPYDSFVEAMRDSHARMYNIRTGRVKPFSDPPHEIPKTGF